MARRYAIRNKWTGKIACAKPRRGIWGGPPDGASPAPKPALGLAFAARGQVQLGKSIKGDVPELGLRKGVLEPVIKPKEHGPFAKPPPPAPTPAPRVPAKRP